MVHEMSVEMAFLAGVHVDGRNVRGAETIKIVLAGHVAGQHRRPDAALLHLHGHLLDEEGLARPYGAHHVDRSDVVRMKSVVDIVPELAVLGKNVRLHADV